MTELPGNWSEDVQIESGKIGMLRFARLKSTEKQSLRRRFEQFRGADRIPSAPAVREATQVTLGKLYPNVGLPTNPFASVLRIAGFDDLADRARVPASGDDLRALTQSTDEVADAVLGLEARATPEQSVELRDALAKMCRALSGEDPALPQPLNLQADLIIAFGARRGANLARATLAAKYFNLSSNPRQCRILASGWHPYYDRRFGFSSNSAEDTATYLPFGEAEAMATVIEEAVPGILDFDVLGRDGTETGLPRLVVDPRARNSLETVVHALPIIHETRALLARPLNVFLVTSTYHVRRTFSIANAQFHRLVDFDESIGKLVCCGAEDKLDQQALVNPSAARHADAIRLYLRESVKLIGGRVTGEF